MWPSCRIPFNDQLLALRPEQPNEDGPATLVVTVVFRGLDHKLLGTSRHITPRSPEGENAAKARRLAVGHRPQQPRLGVARSGKAETLPREIERPDGEPRGLATDGKESLGVKRAIHVQVRSAALGELIELAPISVVFECAAVARVGSRHLHTRPRVQQSSHEARGDNRPSVSLLVAVGGPDEAYPLPVPAAEPQEVRGDIG